MKAMNVVRRFGGKVGTGATMLAVSAGTALASSPDLTSSAQTAISAAADDGLTVGGYVIAAVAALVVIGIILSVVRRVR